MPVPPPDRALGGGGDQRPWVFLSHSLGRIGPPIYLLHLLRWLAVHDPRPVEVVSLADGPLRSEFEALGRVTVLAGMDPGRLTAEQATHPSPPDAEALHRALAHLDDVGLVHVNTAISVRALRYLPPVAAPVVAHVHELEIGLSVHIRDEDRADLHAAQPHWVAASQAVAANLAARHGVPADAIAVHHEMIDAHPRPAARATADLRAGLGIPADAPVVGTAAVVSWRKGPDLFALMARRVLEDPHGAAAHLVWLGADEADPVTGRFRADLRAAGLADRVHVVPAVADPLDWLRAFDVFVLPAREDAFPLACLEAASVARPVVCFNTGGMPELVEDDAGIVVPYPDLDGLAGAVTALLADPARAERLGRTGQAKVRARHDVSVAAPRLHADLLRWVEGWSGR